MSAQTNIHSTYITNLHNFEAEGPRPLLHELPPGDAYPFEALGPLRAAVEAVQGMTLAPVAIPAASALAVAALAVQAHVDVETLGGRRPTSLYMLTIAASGERKSSCDAPMMAGLRAFEHQQFKTHGEKVSAWENARAVWKIDRDSVFSDLKKQTDDQRIAAQADLAALGPEPAPPPFPGRTVKKLSMEGITRQFREGMPSLGIFSDEGGHILGGYAMSKDNRLATMAALNDLWQGTETRVALAGQGSYILFGRRLSVHLMTQPLVAREFLDDPMGVDTGLLARFLICEPPSTIGTRKQSMVRADGPALAVFEARLQALLREQMPLDPDTRALEPRLLRLSAEARAVLVGFADHVEFAQAAGRHYASVTSFASKAAEMAARIAAVLTVWEDLHAPEVSLVTMQNAIVLAEFYLSEAWRLSNAALVSAAITKAETLRKWVLHNWPHDDITPSEVQSNAPIRALRGSPAARSAIDILEKHGWLEKLPEGAVVRGKQRKLAYRIVRGDHEV